MAAFSADYEFVYYRKLLKAILLFISIKFNVKTWKGASREQIELAPTKCSNG